jgi:hypothetical protein
MSGLSMSIYRVLLSPRGTGILPVAVRVWWMRGESSGARHICFSFLSTLLSQATGGTHAPEQSSVRGRLPVPRRMAATPETLCRY